MFDRFTFHHQGTSYVVIDAWSPGRSKWAGGVAFERVPHVEARWVLEGLARHDEHLFDQLYRAVTGEQRYPAPCGSYRIPGPFGLSNPRVDTLVGMLGHERWTDSRGSVVDHARIYLMRGAVRSHRTAALPESPETQRIDKALAQLAREPLISRGESYLLVRATEEARVPNRNGYETLSERQLFDVLGQLEKEPGRSPDRAAALQELRSAAELQRQKVGNTDLLLLRRLRSYSRSVEETAVPITPSRLRKETHWIEVQAVDPNQKPVSGVELEFVLADKSTRRRSTDDDGFARLQPIPAGEVTIRLPKLDLSRWRPLTGAGASPSNKKGAARVHAVRQGECLSKIASRYGFTDFETIWNAAENEALRKRRKSPHVLYPGDQVVIPGIEVGEILRAADASHQLEMKGAQLEVEISLLLEGLTAEPLAGHSCVVRYRGPQGPVELADLQLGDDGSLKFSVPAQVDTIELEIPDLMETLELALSGLDPVADEDATDALLSGVEQRLHALGYAQTPRGKLDDSTRAALATFQSHELGHENATGELDSETCSALEEAYGT